jgi:uncharacterized membrane protein
MLIKPPQLNKDLRFTSHPLFFLMFIAVTGFYTALTYFPYKAFRSQNCMDLANISQILSNFVNGNGLFSTIGVGQTQNAMADHFRIILVLFAPLYYPFQNGYVIIFLSVIFTTITVFTLTRIAERFFGWKTAAILFPIILLSPSVTNMYTTFLGKDMVFATGFLSLSLLFYVEDRFWPWVGSLVLTSFCTEYISLIFVGYAFSSLLHGKNRRWAVFSLLYGVGYFYLASGIIMPALRNDKTFAGAHFDVFGYMGNNPCEIAGYIVTHPLEIFKIITEPYKLKIYIILLGLVLFIPLLGLDYLLIPISQFLLMQLPKDELYTAISMWYHAPLVPFIFVAAFAGIERLKRYFDIKPPIIASIMLIPLVLIVFVPYLNVLAISLGKSFQSFDRDNKAAYEYIVNIPRDASVSAQDAFLPVVSQRRECHIYPTIKDADYVVIGLNRSDYAEEPLKSMLLKGDYGAAMISRNIIVLKKGHPTTHNAEAYALANKVLADKTSETNRASGSNRATGIK